MQMPEPQNPARNNQGPVLELISALTQSEAKRQIDCPPELTVTQKEFYDAFVAQLARKRLPARATLQRVSWDHGQRPQEMIAVAFTGNEAPAEVVRIIVGFKQMGSFVYVERMLTFLPPKLLQPRKMQTLIPLEESHEPEDPNVANSRLLGLLLIVFAVVSFLAPFIDGYAPSNFALYLPIAVVCAGTALYVFRKAKALGTV